MQSYRLENSKLKKQISQISEELEKRTRDEQMIQSYKEEQNTKKDQVKQMIEQWKEAMPDIPFVCIRLHFSTTRFSSNSIANFDLGLSIV